jgi:hypothetical protein
MKTNFHADGSTYDPALDKQRLGSLQSRVEAYMLRSGWRTLAEIREACGGSEASVSARVRDMRKSRNGGFTVERRRGHGGLWLYRVAIAGGQ